MTSLVITSPLKVYMDSASLVETVRLRVRSRGKGLSLESSSCKQVSDEDFVRMNLSLLTGLDGWLVVDEFFHMLQMPHMLETCYPGCALSLDTCFPLIVAGMADAYRRLVFPSQALPWTLLDVAVLTNEEALSKLQAVDRQCSCRRCRDPLFSGLFIDFALKGGPEQDTPVRVAAVQQLFWDLLLELPGSSVEVEKQHANIQVDCQIHRSSAKRTTTIQANSYVMAAVLEHNTVKSMVEKECMGGMAGAARRVMRKRIIDSSAPTGALFLKKKGFKPDFTVKKRDGLLKGMLFLALCFMQTFKNRCVD